MSPRLSVYFDGLCPLCSREIAHYRKRSASASVEFVDIAAPGFDATTLGLDSARIHKHMHAQLDGKMVVGVDAFLAIWQIVPGFRWLHAAVALPVVYPFAKLAYAAFAEVRPYLPRRKLACEAGVCNR